MRLLRPPLLEAVFEIRFQPASHVATELVPGLLFPHLKSYFPKAEQTGLGAIPNAVRQRRPELAYSHTIKFHGEGQTVLLGDHVFGLSCPVPYPGWSAFRDRCIFVVDA